MKAFRIYSFVFFIGGTLYTLIELIWRGHTHVSMTFAGGLCLAGLYWFDKHASSLTFISKCIIGAMGITAVEFATGFMVNRVFELQVWDYSDRFLNLMGQVCPLFTFLWFLICIPALGICKAVEKLANDHV